MRFVIYGIDRENTDLRARLIDQHRAYMADHPLKILSSGPLTDDEGKAMIGSLLIVEADTRSAVEAFLADEPMNKAGLYRMIEIRAWHQRVGRFADP